MPSDLLTVSVYIVCVTSRPTTNSSLHQLLFSNQRNASECVVFAAASLFFNCTLAKSAAPKSRESITKVQSAETFEYEWK